MKDENESTSIILEAVLTIFCLIGSLALIVLLIVFASIFFVTACIFYVMGLITNAVIFMAKKLGKKK